MKPAELIVVAIEPVRIGYFVVTTLEIDLNHVNYGLDPKTKKNRVYSRSNHTAEFIADLFGFLSIMVGLYPSAYENDFFYFSETIETNGKFFSITFCVDEKNPSTAGIITLYRVNPRK